MSNQLTFGFQADPVAPPLDGKARKTQGTKRVLDNAGDWKDQAIELIRQLAARQAEFTSDDVRQLAEESGLPAPHHKNVWGAIVAACARAGIITPTGRFTKSQRPDAHARVIGVWRSKIAKGKAT